MPVIVLTTIEPPPPPPTGFGGNLFLPGGAFDNDVDGSLRAPDDDSAADVAVAWKAMDNEISGSLRAPDDVGENIPAEAVDNTISGSLRTSKDVALTWTPSGANLVGSPNIGDV